MFWTQSEITCGAPHSRFQKYALVTYRSTWNIIGTYMLYSSFVRLLATWGAHSIISAKRWDMWARRIVPIERILVFATQKPCAAVTAVVMFTDA